jgi:hypothetical protein
MTIPRRWAIRVGIKEGQQILTLRNEPNTQVLFLDAEIWLQSKISGHWDDESNVDLLTRIRKIFGAVRFHVLDDDQLIRFGNRVPDGRLPTGDWQPLTSQIELEMPIAGLTGSLESSPPLTLTRGASRYVGPAREPELLRCSLDDWSKYASTAPLVRLQPLTFACDDQRRVLVKGNPLPPVQGELFALSCGVATPLGWCWEPAVSPKTLRASFPSPADTMILWNSDGRWNQISSSQFVVASRSAVRLTLDKMSNHELGDA